MMIETVCPAQRAVFIASEQIAALVQHPENDDYTVVFLVGGGDGCLVVAESIMDFKSRCDAAMEAHNGK